jgi:hypothetical protein
VSLFCSHVSCKNYIVIKNKEIFIMKTYKSIKSDLTVFAASGKARLVLMVLIIALFVLAAGAPGATGGVGD